MKKQGGHKRIGEGEVTGHTHRVTAEDAYVEGEGDVRCLRNPTETDVVHEEHKPIRIVGDRTVFGQQEIDPDTEEARKVID